MLKFRSAISAAALMLILFIPCSHAVTRDEVVAGAESMYLARITEAQSQYQLDNDRIFLARVQRILDGLIKQAKLDHPNASEFAWELHITDAPDESASCMAGGKLLLGQPYVIRLELTDAELAMLLSHEMQHALLDHNFKEFQEALKLEPGRRNASFLELEEAIDHDDALMSKLSEFDKAQESEADLEGLRMAWRAGWSALGLAGYFKKLEHADPMPNSDHFDHPASALRRQAARQLATELSQRKVQPESVAVPDVFTQHE